ncbi:MAG: hypothetical protein EOO45_25515 [Flavobacterium sp.]|nr:MAG: hypothetical protein EOO45_25515 [Flavobacterium sp.]
MEGLLKTFLDLISPWDNTFPRQNSSLRAKIMSLSILLTMGRKLFSRAIATSGRDQFDWSANYKLFSRCKWSICSLFRPIISRSIELIDGDLIAVGFDDTLVKKTGKRIKGCSWLRDSLSPHFCNNIVWGMRYLQASILLPLYKDNDSKLCRGIPIQFTQLPKFKKPSWKASDEKWQAYKELIKTFNTSTTFVKQLRYLRNELNLMGYSSKRLLAVVDSSFTNRTCFTASITNTNVIGRTRKNARLYFRSKTTRRFYDPVSVTAEELRKNTKYSYEICEACYAGERRVVQFKEFKEIYWKYGTKKKPLRLFILAPTPYRRTHASKLEYRDAAYLLTTSFDLPAEVLIQKYLDRWQIEVNFKEEKGHLSLGKQQVWSEKSIPRTPAFIVASYAALTLAGVLHFNDERTDEIFEILPKWRKNNGGRPSFQDLLTVLRKEMLNQLEHSRDGPDFNELKDRLLFKAAA